MKKLLLTGIVFAFSMSAEASTLTYELHDVVFDDGATASGSFDWSSQDGFANISITTTASQMRDYDVTYKNKVTPGVIGINFGVSLAAAVGNDTTSYWNISFEPDGPQNGDFYLTTMINRPIPYFSYHEYDSQGSYIRAPVSGYIAPVPIPAAFWLFGASLGGLILKRNRS